MKCLICKNKKFDILYKENLKDNISPENFKITDNNYSVHTQIVCCKNCGFNFSYPRPSKEDLNFFYSKLADQEYGKEEEGRKINFKSILKNLDFICKEKGKLLDVGCASGLFLSQANKQGWDACGLDPCESLIAKARKSNLNVKTTDILDYNPPYKFKVITVLDVLEHVNAPEQLLRKCYQLLENDGVLVIVTPNIKSRIARMLKEKWWHIRIAHIYYFDDKSLSTILEKNNLKTILKKTYKWNFSFNYWHSRIAGFSQKIYLITRKFFTIIPHFDEVIGKRIISLDFKDSFEWYCVKKESVLLLKEKKSFIETIKDFIITAGFLGKIPLLPATFTCFVFALLNIYILHVFPNYLRLINLVILIISVLFCLFLEKFAQKKYFSQDPREFTLDELAAMSMIYSFIPINSAFYIALAFFVFRFFDIVKLWPIRIIERKKIIGSVLWDDIIAGLFTLLILQILKFFLK